MANRYLTEEQQAFATQDPTADDPIVKGLAYSTTTLSLENNIVLNLIFFNDTLGGNLEELEATITYSSHADPDTVLTRKISGNLFGEYTSKNGRARCVVEVDFLAVADGNQIITCEIRDKDGNLVGAVTESFNGYTARVINAGVTDVLYPAILKFSLSTYAYLHP